jgi:uncharacterized protein
MRQEGEDPLAAAQRIGLALDHSVLPIQGPPGAGKTYIGARMITALLAAGLKVGITANSHKVIGNLLGAVCRAAREENIELRAIQRCDEEDVLDDPAVLRAEKNPEVEAALSNSAANLAAGTAWLWARPELAEAVDVLFVDEAGQMTLANALASAQAAKSLVLLGDPMQLDQPMKGVHPPGVAVSALSHLLGNASTLPSDRGLFLGETWRLHPDLCAITSVAFYERRLTAQPHLAGQRVTSLSQFANGTGPRLLFADHVGHDNASEEEAALIAKMARELVESGAVWVDGHGVERPIGWDDVLIVAAYNAQVAEIQRLLPEARVGTVDKFQGQEAPISFYSMASSSADDAPRGMSFLFNRNRLNVATSRAKCLAFVVCAPALLYARVRTVDDMRLANTLCLFALHAAGE